MGIQKGAIVVDTERCKGCGLCTVVCRHRLVRMSQHVNHKGYNYAEQVDADLCNGCTACAVACPDGCISVYRTKSKSQTSEQ